MRRRTYAGADPGFCQGGWLADPKKFLKLKVPDWLKMHFLAPLQ